MSESKEPDIFELIGQLATAEQIKSLLREYKNEFPEDVYVSGSKTEIIRHLRVAVDRGRIPQNDVADLLQEAEENGDQHILYFKPKSNVVAKKCRDGEEIAKSLWGDEWRKMTKFPRYELVPKSFEWADFRIGLKKKPNDWIAKVYGQEVAFRFIRQETLEDGTLAKYYKTTETRAVCLARWNGPDLLEMRVERCESKAQLLVRLNSLWTRLKPAIVQDDFIPWDFKAARKKLLEERSANKEIYHTGSIALTDSASGKAIFHPYTEEEGTDDAKDGELPSMPI